MSCEKCGQLVALLSDYIENKLPADARTDLETHLSGCRECTTFVASFRQTVSLLHSLTEDELPEELRLRLKAFLDEHSRC